MLKISQFPPRGCGVPTWIRSNSLRFDPQAHNLKKEDTFKHDMQLLDRQDFPRFGQNLDQKITLRRAKHSLTASVRGTIPPEPKLDLP